MKSMTQVPPKAIRYTRENRCPACASEDIVRHDLTGIIHNHGELVGVTAWCNHCQTKFAIDERMTVDDMCKIFDTSKT